MQLGSWIGTPEDPIRLGAALQHTCTAQRVWSNRQKILPALHGRAFAPHVTNHPQDRGEKGGDHNQFTAPLLRRRLTEWKFTGTTQVADKLHHGPLSSTNIYPRNRPHKRAASSLNKSGLCPEASSNLIGLLLHLKLLDFEFLEHHPLQEVLEPLLPALCLRDAHIPEGLQPIVDLLALLGESRERRSG